MAGQHHGHGHEQHERHHQRAHVVPPAPVQAAGEPHHRSLGVVDLGPRHEVRRDRGQHGGGPDPDQHQAVAGDPPLVGQQVDGDPGERGAGQGPPGHLVGRAVEHDDHQHRAGGRPGVDPDDVGAGQRVAGDALEDGARQAEGGADEQGDEAAGEPQGADDEVGVLAAPSDEGADHVAERDREVADRQRPREHRQGNGQHHQRDDDRAPVEPGRHAAVTGAQHHVAVRARVSRRRGDGASTVTLIRDRPACGGGRGR